MITVQMTEETYMMVRDLMATSLECDMFHGRIREWDETNELWLKALIELTKADVG